MPSDESSEENSSSGTPSRSPTPPEALALGREKRATAGNRLRALLDAEFQEEEIFAEEQDDEEFIRAKSDDEEGAYLSSSSSDSEGEGGDEDEQAGERELEEERKRARDVAAAKKRKAAATPFIKPVVKRPRVPTAPSPTTGILASKPASTTSSVSNRRISFDPNLLAARRSSRKLTVQITNETQERIISAAARRATLTAVPKRERTPPLTQEQRLAQAVLTEEENKMSLQRIIQAEEERARKRREKLEALRRRRFDEPVLQFVSRKRALIEEVPEVVVMEEEVVVVEVVDEGMKVDGEEGLKGDDQAAVGDDVTNGEPVESTDGEKMIVDDKLEDTSSSMEKANKPVDESAKESEANSPEPDEDASNEVSHFAKAQSTTSPVSREHTEKMDGDESGKPDGDDNQEPTNDVEVHDGDATNLSSATTPKPPKDDTDKESPKSQASETPVQEQVNQDAPSEKQEPASPTAIQEHPSPPSPPKSPPPYHEAYYASNTLSILQLPNTPIHSVRETFFPLSPTTAPLKPKPAARCPITGLAVRYRDPLTGVGYYDIHAFAILREVSRPGSRYVWSDEGGWFVGEHGPTGRPAQGVPDGWFN
jgi:hypothetical protein